jgi:predicted sulfurtransferase
MSHIHSPSRLTLQTRAQEITPHQLWRVKPLPVIIDIRKEEEFSLGHIEGAKHIAQDDLQEKVSTVPAEIAGLSLPMIYEQWATPEPRF